MVRTDDNQFHLFTYERDSVRAASAVRGARVRVVAGSSDENGTRVASRVTVLEAKPAEAGAAGTQAAPVPPKIREIESDIKRETDAGERACVPAPPLTRSSFSSACNHKWDLSFTGTYSSGRTPNSHLEGLLIWWH
jgi:hypothetical protein